jgi:hypothetical protein
MKRLLFLPILSLCFLATANLLANVPIFPKGNKIDTFPSKYNVGDLLPITRYDGIGIGSHFVEMEDSMYQKILSGNFNGAITYKAGKAPIEVKVINPLALKEGDYEINFYDKTMTDNILEADAKWKLSKSGDPEVIFSTQSIATFNEQIIQKYGFSVGIGQTTKPAADPLNIPNNGAIGGTISYKDATKPKWFSGIADKDSTYFDFISADSQDPNNQFSKNYANVQFYPYGALNYKPRIDTLGQFRPFLSPAWHNIKNVSYQSKRASTNNIDLIFTPDKSKWSRCLVVETNNKMYTDDGLPSKSAAENMSLRSDKSIGNDTNPDALSDGTIGKSWFPGYAVDVETGQRLMVFFGENSGYDLTENPPLTHVYQFAQTPTGGDMIWNPSADVIVKNIGDSTIITVSNLVAGCGHYIYVTDLPYSEWKTPYDALLASPNVQQSLVKNIRWASMPILQNANNFLSYKKGLIPNECTIKLRVDNPYQVLKGVGTNNFHPAYRFSIKNNMINTAEKHIQDTDNQSLNIYPNPILTTQMLHIGGFEQGINARIYNQEGREIHRFAQSEMPFDKATLQWNLANEKLSSGVYFIVVKTTKGWKTGKFVVIA